MTKTVQFKRYSTSALSAMTGAPGEIIVNTDNNTLTVHDGATVGGTYLATQAQLNANVSILNTTASNTKQNIWTATQSFAGNTTAEAIKTNNIAETVNLISTGISTTQTFYVANGAVQYWTSNATANGTLNITWSTNTTMASAMAVGDSISIAALVTNGSPGYYFNAYQVDGNAVSPKWQANTAPSNGFANGVDGWTFTIIKTAATPTYLVLGSQTQYK